MSMRIEGGYSGGWGAYQNASAVGAQQQDRKNLFAALRSGDLTAAQTAFTALQNRGISANSPLNAIGQSLQSGDLAGAQKAAQSMHAGHGHRARVNDGDADDSPAQSAGGVSSSSTSTASTAPQLDPATAFTSFMQNLETALEQQDPSFTSASSSQPANPTTTPSTQAVLWSKGAGFTTSVSDASLKADIEKLIQQLSQTTTESSSSSTAATDTQTGSTSTNTSTASILQTSFSALLGSWGAQNSGASVMNFLQSLDASLSAPPSTLNKSA